MPHGGIRSAQQHAAALLQTPTGGLGSARRRFIRQDNATRLKQQGVTSLQGFVGVRRANAFSQSRGIRWVDPLTGTFWNSLMRPSLAEIRRRRSEMAVRPGFGLAREEDRERLRAHFAGQGIRLRRISPEERRRLDDPFSRQREFIQDPRLSLRSRRQAAFRLARREGSTQREAQDIAFSVR